jgi:predicted aspartyl protease
MVKLSIDFGLPFCTVTLVHEGKSLSMDKVLLDTGSGGTVFKMDNISDLNITIEKNDTIEAISGIGGKEFVYRKNIDKIKFGDFEIENFMIEVGIMDYDFEINGILGMNFLKKVGAIIDLDKMAVYKGRS